MTTMEEAKIMAKEIRARLAAINETTRTAAHYGISVEYQVEPGAVTKGPQLPHFELKAQIRIEL